MTDADPRIVVGVGAAVVSGRDLLLIQRGREPAKGLWAVPGGKVEKGERLRDTVAREVKEETGLEVEIGEVVWAGESIGDHGHIVLIDYLAEVSGGTLKAGDDAADVAWVDIDEASDWPLTLTMYELIDILRNRR